MIAHIHEATGKEQTVLEHLENTAGIAEKIGGDMNMGNLSYFTALFHDLGKWRRKFEEYIRTAAAGGRSKSGKINHSSAGGIYIYEHYYKDTHIEKLTAQLMAAAILSHHGLTDIISPEGKPVYIDRVKDKQDLDYEEALSHLYSGAIRDKDMKALFTKAVNEVQAFILKFEVLAKKTASVSGNDKEKRDKECTAYFYFIALLERMLLSIVIDSDRLDTASFCADRPVHVLQSEKEAVWRTAAVKLEDYLKQFKGEDRVSLLRRQIADECLNFAGKGSGIYRLSVPTGGAKTLSSLRYAVNHAKKYKKKRIFYLAPYLSILEQNAEVFRKALDMDEFILEHHSNVIVESEEDEKHLKYKYLSENWEAPVVITTFVQFLNALFSGSTRDIRRFHNLADSVIIIDEIQSLPIKMIDNFNLAMNFLHEVFNTTVVLCSATQPKLEQAEYPLLLTDEKDIITDYASLYEALKRVEVRAMAGNYDSEGLARFAVEIMETEDNLLIVLNTKKAVRSVYEKLKSCYSHEKENLVKVIHLSTNMCAEHRLKIIEEIKHSLGKEKLICISTNLIEAGVDLSFACVIRSYAGLDCIVQAAGRCNRNGEMGDRLGVVYLVHMNEECLGRLEQIRIGAGCSEDIVKHYGKHQAEYDNSLLSPRALEVFYSNYYYGDSQRKWMEYPIKELGTTMLKLLSRNGGGVKSYIRKYGSDAALDLCFAQAFKTAGENFMAIEKDAIGVIVPYGEGADIIAELNRDAEPDDIFKILRKAQRYTVNLYRNQIEELSKMGALVKLMEGRVTALKDGFYDEDIGVNMEGNMGFLLVD